MASVVVKHGWLRRVIGFPARFNGFVFAAVLADLDHETYVEPFLRYETIPQYPLADFSGNPEPRVIAACQNIFGERADAVWVRARIPVIFGFAPVSLLQEDYKYALLDQAFVACRPSVVEGEWIAYPFVCTDYNLRVGLKFSPDGPEQGCCQEIASAFWALLLNEPERVHSFRDGYYLCAGQDEGWLVVEYYDGELAIKDGEDWNEDED